MGNAACGADDVSCSHCRASSNELRQASRLEYDPSSRHGYGYGYSNSPLAQSYEVGSCAHEIEPECTEALPAKAESIRLQADVKAKAEDIVVEDLVNKGFFVRQLLEFYRRYQQTGLIKRGTTTNDVVKEIVIKETCDPPRCYMESEFMMQQGGPQRAKRLVSHAWKSEFLNTVISIVLDVTEWSLNVLLQGTSENDYQEFVLDGILDVDHLLSKISNEALRSTYWLCIFAIDEHHAICGDCWACNTKLAWTQNQKAHLVANACLICGKDKFNPCICGTTKWKPTDPQSVSNR